MNHLQTGHAGFNHFGRFRYGVRDMKIGKHPGKGIYAAIRSHTISYKGNLAFITIIHSQHIPHCDHHISMLSTCLLSCCWKLPPPASCRFYLYPCNNWLLSPVIRNHRGVQTNSQNLRPSHPTARYGYQNYQTPFSEFRTQPASCVEVEEGAFDSALPIRLHTCELTPLLQIALI